MVLFPADEWSILPSLIFLGVGAMTDFGPLIANPISFLMGAAAQLGIYSAYFFAILLGFSGKESAAISIIGGADGPTSILVASRLAADYLPPSLLRRTRIWRSYRLSSRRSCVC